jgi:hypothetical protein
MQKKSNNTKKYWKTAEGINKVLENTSGVCRTINYIGFLLEQGYRKF